MENQYIFLPWMRRGLARQIKEADPLMNAAIADTHAKINISLTVQADGTANKPIKQEIVLLGPGDITDIDSSAIVKTEPSPGVRNFEPNFFPYIDFYEEDYLWRYSPAKANKDKRLRPWLSLLVLEAFEFTRVRSRQSRGIRSILIDAINAPTALPKLEQSWAWAHVQVNEGNLTATDLADGNTRNQHIAKVLNENPNLGVSRLLCPRKLKVNTKYYAFVVPAFESGRIAGLGGTKPEIEAAGRFQPSWNNAAEVELPVYYEWSFQTGVEDFEELAKKILPQDLTGTEVGKLWMDASNINYGGNFDYSGNLDSSNPQHEGFLPFEGALRLPGDPVIPLTLRVGTEESKFVTNFAGLINLGVQYRLDPAAIAWGKKIPGNENDDPLLVPPIYGRWHVKPDGNATVNPSVNKGNWLEQLNLDPAFRVAAGLGAEVVKESQEEFVTRAWEQLADNRRNLNREAQRLRFAQAVTTAAYKKHFVLNSTTPGGAARILSITQSIHTVVKSDTAQLSIAGKLNDYKTETAFVQPAYRRITRTKGPVMQRVKAKTAYSLMVMSSDAQFAVMAFSINTNPPFQNFDCAKLTSISHQNFVSIQPQVKLIGIQNPRWIQGIAGGFTMGIIAFSNIFKELQVQLLGKPAKGGGATPPVDVRGLSLKLMAKILPATSFRVMFQAMLPLGSPASVANNDNISPNSFNPGYKDPMYERLEKLRQDLFIPNLDLVKPNSFILLQANQGFIESFMLGLNHELAAEFLWRGFPADMNATFFREFWDKSDSIPSVQGTSDIKFIREWKLTNALGKNGPFNLPPLVFIIKAELVQKHPNLVVYAQKAKLINENKNRVPDTAPESIISPIFTGTLSPDYLFAGFELTREQVLGITPGDPGTDENKPRDGYYFVIAERPGEIHFGLDLSRKPGVPLATWNDLAWADLKTAANYLNLQKDIAPSVQTKEGIEWGKGQKPVSPDPTAGTGDAAQMAKILIQKPVQIFVHASMVVSIKKPV